MSCSTWMYESDTLRRSSSLRSLVEPEVLIPVRQKKTRRLAGFLLWLADQDYSRMALALRAAVATLRRSSSLRSLVEPEVLIPVRQKKTRRLAGFLLWLAD
jgi:hypothetical protein